MLMVRISSAAWSAGTSENAVSLLVITPLFQHVRVDIWHGCNRRRDGWGWSRSSSRYYSASMTRSDTC